MARPLWAFAYRATSNDSDADDIVQETFLRLLRAAPPELDAEGLRRYTFRIASNLMADRWRAAGRERGSEEHAPLEPIADSSLDQADGEDLRRLFGRLRARDRALLWLAYVEGLSHEEIGAAMALARGSVKVMLSRARARLRDLLHARGLSGEKQ